jgi:hypothetical protein
LGCFVCKEINDASYQGVFWTGYDKVYFFFQAKGIHGLKIGGIKRYLYPTIRRSCIAWRYVQLTDFSAFCQVFGKGMLSTSGTQ